MASKRTYPREFKVEAVALAKSSGKSISEIERELGTTVGLLAKWKQRLKTDGEQAFSGKGRLKEDDELIRRLQRENDVLRQERDVLKKALVIFSMGFLHNAPTRGKVSEADTMGNVCWSTAS